MTLRTLHTFFQYQSISFLFILLPAGLLLGGCESSRELQRINQEQAATIAALNDEIGHLNEELDAVFSSRDELARAKADLEQNLGGTIATGGLAVSMQPRGLVVTVLDRVLFDSGRVQLKDSARVTLHKVAETLREKLGGHIIFVEGHTDNVPIHRSRWPSNWELSTARATEVVHFFIDYENLDPHRLAAVGYGPYQPIASNDTEEGRQKNRRVEIVISPQKISGEEAAETSGGF